MPNFPKPYLDRILENDPMIKKVPMDGAPDAIGQGRSSLPKAVNSDGMTIKHTGGSLGKGE